jgi:hypothetical protein
MQQSFRWSPNSKDITLMAAGYRPKAVFTVAWGNAPGLDNLDASLAEGHIQAGYAVVMNMAFGQSPHLGPALLGFHPRLR